MKEERMMILSMLKEGKISSEEAVKLLEALENSETKNTIEKDRFIDMDKTKVKVEEFGDTVKEQGKKVGDIGVDLGNKIAKAFADMRDDINFDGLLNNTESLNAKAVMDVSHIENPIIDLKSINGHIFVENWEEDHILIEINCRYKDGLLNAGQSFYELYDMENKIVFAPKYDSKIMMNLKVYLPDRDYEEIHLNTSNGQLSIEDFNMKNLVLNTTNAAVNVNDINAEEIHLNTKNGKVILEDINAPIIKANSSNASIIVDNISSETFHVNTKNGKITLEDIVAQDIIATTANAPIEVNDISSLDIILTTSNSRITLEDIDTEIIEYLELSTSNSSINVKLDDINRDIYLDLETSIGNIDLEIGSLVYEMNKQANLGKKKIIAHSVDLNKEEEHLKLFATTSNGSIKIY